MTRREPRDLAGVLLEKAEQDLTVVRILLDGDEEIDEIVAFHAQQACEKSIKAVLALHAVRVGKTHNLAELIGKTRENGIDLPAWVDETAVLTPFGVTLRYAEAGDDDTPPERHSMYEMAARVVALARDLIEQEV